jgi:hypothetical protein
MIRTGQNTLSEKKERGTKRDSGKLEGKVDVISFSYIKKQISYMYMTLTSGCWLELPAPNFFFLHSNFPLPSNSGEIGLFFFNLRQIFILLWHDMKHIFQENLCSYLIED